MSTHKGWIGIDLDRTLAEYHTERPYNPLKIGEPLWPMVNRISDWLSVGQDVKIFTARASGFDLDTAEGKAGLALVVDAIQTWLEKACRLPRLEVTCIKDYRCIQIWDDIAVPMVPNTGYPAIRP
jgi:hypothetical protein